MSKYERLIEHALANFTTLLDYWGIEYQQINTNEYDLIATWRADGNFGAVRFNTYKGRGSDFAGISIAAMDFKSVGEGFGREDFAGFIQGTNTNTGFDIIGLCRKVYNIATYRDAAERLLFDLQTIAQTTTLSVANPEAAKLRAERIQEQTRKHIEYAQQTWKYCKNIKFEGSFADIYLTSRGLANAKIRENNIRFHPKVMNKELGKTCPAVLFKVSVGPFSELVAIHRIYLTENGLDKAPVENPKMAIGAIKGAAIWFGNPCERLGIAEGPENALTMRELGEKFVASSVYATNMANIIIPENVSEVIIYPDPDAAGEINMQKAAEAYRKQGKKVGIRFPPKVEQNNKLLDWNDILQEAL